MKYATDRATLDRICTVEFTRGSGPGGQHRNKVETAVRVTHPPSGISVLAQSHRSQGQNLEDAFARLIEKLDKLNFVPTPRRPTKPSRASKRRRLDSKRRESQKKQQRRGGSDD
jgi:protein subunit release factor B